MPRYWNKKSEVPWDDDSIEVIPIIVRDRRFWVPMEPWTPHALPNAPSLAGRPVWEPPILDYGKLINEEFDKKREAALKFTKGDVVRTTGIMDYHTEIELVRTHKDWAGKNAVFLKDPESKNFFASLVMDLEEDWRETSKTRGKRAPGAHFYQQEDGTYICGSVRTMLNLEMGLSADWVNPDPDFSRCRKYIVGQGELPPHLQSTVLPEAKTDNLEAAKADQDEPLQPPVLVSPRLSWKSCLSCLSGFFS